MQKNYKIVLARDLTNEAEINDFHEQSEELIKAMALLHPDQQPAVFVDCSQNAQFSILSLGELNGLKKAALNLGGKITLVGPTENFLADLKATNFYQGFTIASVEKIPDDALTPFEMGVLKKLDFLHPETQWDKKKNAAGEDVYTTKRPVRKAGGVGYYIIGMLKIPMEGSGMNFAPRVACPEIPCSMITKENINELRRSNALSQVIAPASVHQK